MAICQPSLQLLTDSLDPLPQNLQRQSPASLTISAWISGSSALAGRGPLAQGHRHSRPAGTVAIEDLQQEGPDRLHGGPESVPPEVPVLSACRLDIFRRLLDRCLLYTAPATYSMLKATRAT